jgi:cell division protein FtsZ
MAKVKSMSLKIVEPTGVKQKIKVIGVGGAGCNALDRMAESNIDGVEFVAVNTDVQALASSTVKEKIQIGRNVTYGLGAGGNPEVGRQAAEEDEEVIGELLDDAEIAFLTSGFGGGTGTGATPVIARIARDKGILVIAVVTKPFDFEGSVRMVQAEQGLVELANTIDTVMVIPNQKLFQVAGDNLTMVDAFRMTDGVLTKSVEAISRLILKPGMMNIDFAHIRTIMSIKGGSVLGFGEADGKERALTAMNQAVSSPMMEEKELKGAKGVLVSFHCGPDLMLNEFKDAVDRIKSISSPEANVIFGASVDPDMEERVMVTVIATGLDTNKVSRTGDKKEEKEKEKDKNVIDLFSERKQGVEKAPSALERGEKLTYKGEDLDEPAYLRNKRKSRFL